MAELQNLDWNSVCQAIATLYNTDAQTISNTLTAQGVELGNVEQAFKMLEDTPYEIWYNSDGTVRSYNYIGQPEIFKNTNAGGVSQLIDSNTQVATKTAVKVPLNTTANTTSPTKTTFKAGLSQTGNFIFKEVLPAVAAANVGITLGKTIDSALYNANPDFWDSHGWGSINPETWASITQNDDSLNATLFNAIFKIDTQTNTSQTYLDQNAVAYLALVLQQLGVFAEGAGRVIDDPSSIGLNIPDGVLPAPTTSGDQYVTFGTSDWVRWRILSGNPAISFYLYNRSNTYWIAMYTASEEPYSFETSGNGIMTQTWSGTRVTKNNKTYYCMILDTSTGIYVPSGIDYKAWSGTNDPASKEDMGYVLLYGYDVEAITGIGTQTGATTPQLSNDDTVAEVLAKLQTQYPSLFSNAVTQDVVQPDGSIKTYTYIPVSQSEPTDEPTEGYDPQTQPVSTVSSQADPEVDPDTATQELLEYLISQLTDTADPNKDNTGGGSSPAVVIPTGSASALYTVYNPTEGEVQSFGGWLWSANFVDQILKMFNDPMQAIISLHKVFCSPSVSGRDNITVGYLDSGVESNVVSGQYVEVNCGSVSLLESFQNVFDYPPFTEVSLYLPFIGFVKLDVNDIMRATISVKYTVDVLTGACLAEVNVVRDMFGGVLYQFSGDCSVHYPLSSGSYMGIVSALLGVAGTVASGGALAPMVIGSVAGISKGKTSVERSGSLSGNAGAMGIKKPYLVIQRPQTNMPVDFETFLGKPSYSKVKISECTGFIKCTEVHALNTPATESELRELVSLLKEGVIL